MYTLGILIDDFFTNSASYNHQPAFVIQKISNYLGILYTMLIFLEALHCKSLQGFTGLLQGNGSAGIPHLQGFAWYEITNNC